MPIQILSDVVAAQIAAGEVVERPASVVKELIENALDAGAHAIRVEAEAGGRRLIRITDDGSGIPSHEAELAFARHATSKLQTIHDLDHIQTLGFRGEALASIAAVAQVTLLTRAAPENAGTYLHIEGGHLVERRGAGTPVGTALTIENLFFNTPARLKFMKADSTERRHIDTIVTRYAMAYPQVRFTLAQDGRVTFSTSGNGDLADVLVEALGIETMRDMIEVTPLDPHRPDLPPIRVYGYSGLPQLSRNTRSHIILFVNGRHIQDNGLGYAVSQAYHTLMPADRYPVAVLMIELAPEDVDVNVHPTKAEVRFRAPDAVFSAVQRAVRRAVIAQAPIPTMTPPPLTDPLQESRLTASYSPSWDNTAAPIEARPAAPSVHMPAQLDLDLPVYDSGRYAQQMESAQRLRTPDPAPQSQTFQQRPRTLPPLRVVGQIAATYIVAEGPAGMYLVDQHAAHERILYEQFMREQATQQPMKQHMLETTTVEVTADSARLIEENLPLLASIGFDLELFGNNTFRVQAMPEILARQSPGEALVTILGDLEKGDPLGASTLEAQIVLRVCKAAAVKAGQILSYDEMQGMLRQLERCEFPRTCPHGRPTMIHLSADQLAKEFGRI
ncbi:MAG: DNA mismatch repair endonuclease MutL [Anaerolineae bacterium]|nr:DNA mismatch repair endonuclease MutL [Anaerolineae bacterium]